MATMEQRANSSLTMEAALGFSPANVDVPLLGKGDDAAQLAKARPICRSFQRAVD